MTEPSTDTDAGSFVSRLRERLGAIEPFSLAMLGLVGFVGDVVPQLEILKLLKALLLFALWPFASMLVGAVRRSLGREGDETGPRDWLQTDEGWRGHAAFLLGLPLSVLNPLMGRQDVAQLLGSLVAVVRHRGSLPAPETYAQSARYRLPVEGTWTVVNGSPMKEYSHSWFPTTQRYAYDFVMTDDEGRSRPAGTDPSVENYYCYDRPVVAPADGVVVDAYDDDPELGRAGGFSHPLKRSITGNRVTIRHAPGEYSSLVHLVPGSVEVDPGDRVERGQRVGRCGHSGNSAEPHLHFQLQDHPTFEVAAGLPVRFDDVDADAPGVDVAADWDEPDGPGEYVHVGQRVAHAPSGEPRRSDDPAGVPDATGVPAPAGALDATVAPGLGGVRTVGRVAQGLSVGGFVTALSGFVTSSLTASASALAGLACLALAYLAGRRLLDGDRPGRESFGTASGVGLAAALVGASGHAHPLAASGPVAVGAGVFATGFVVYVGVWEYGRRSLFRDGAPANSAD